MLSSMLSHLNGRQSTSRACSFHCTILYHLDVLSKQGAAPVAYHVELALVLTPARVYRDLHGHCVLCVLATRKPPSTQSILAYPTVSSRACHSYQASPAPLYVDESGSQAVCKRLFNNREIPRCAQLPTYRVGTDSLPRCFTTRCSLCYVLLSWRLQYVAV